MEGVSPPYQSPSIKNESKITLNFKSKDFKIFKFNSMRFSIQRVYIPDFINYLKILK